MTPYILVEDKGGKRFTVKYEPTGQPINWSGDKLDMTFFCYLLNEAHRRGAGKQEEYENRTIPL